MKVNKIQKLNIENKMGTKNDNPLTKNTQFQTQVSSLNSAVNPQYWQKLTFRGNEDKLYEQCKHNCDILKDLGYILNEDFDYEKHLKQLYAFYKNVNIKKAPNYVSFCDIANGSKDEYDDLQLSEKQELYKGISAIVEDENNLSDPDFSFALPLINKLKTDLSIYNLPVSSDKAKIEEFNRSIFVSKKENKGGLNNFESIIVNSISEFKKMKNGLSLKYKKEDFLGDLSFILNDKGKREDFCKKTGIVFKVKDDKIKGYIGLLNIDNLEEKHPAYEICHKFLYENEIETGNTELDAELNKIIYAAPEFINIIGKKNDKKSEYPLDIHSLLTLAYAIEDDRYKTLENKDKIILKASCLFSDIGFENSFKKRTERNLSSMYSREILGKFITNEEILSRSFRISKVHSRIKSYYDINGDVSQEELAYQLRGKNDVKIAYIMAKADARAMGKKFYSKYKDSFSKEAMDEISAVVKHMHSNGIAIITDYPVNEEKTNQWKTKIKGKEYKVLNLYNIAPDEDMEKYGFNKDVKKDELYFLVHMVSDAKNLTDFKTLIKSANEAVMSESLITPKNKKTLDDRKYGFILAQNNFDIINASREDQGSGTLKSEQDAIEFIFDYSISDRRDGFKKSFLEGLNISSEDVNEADFAEFYNSNLSGKTSFIQFPVDKKYILGKKTLNGEMIITGIKKYQDELTEHSEDYNNHNEIIGTSPKIKALVAKEKNPENLPSAFLKFARENDLPIILI